MTDPNRGAYTPQSDAPLAFDARRASGPGQRPMPITLIISAIILVVLVVGALILYKNGPRHADEAPQPVGTPVGAVKGPIDAKPVDAPPGLQVYADGQPVSAAPKFAPPPEQPAARPAPSEALPLRPAQPEAASQNDAAPPAPKVEKAAPPPEPRVAAAPAAKAAPAPKAKPEAPVKLAVAPTQPPAKTPPPTSAAEVQIGAFSTAALADAGWNKVARVSPGDMVGKTKTVEKIDRDGQALYRALVGGFASRADADSFCATLRDKGQACTVRN